MNRIAILGASSQIAKDLIRSIAHDQSSELLLYARGLDSMSAWLAAEKLDFPLAAYEKYGREPHDTVISFVGVGDPRRALQLGGDIFSLTQRFDDLVLDALAGAPDRRYFFMSSGAAYCSDFQRPADADTRSSLAVNRLVPQDFYAIAKLNAECRHRALPQYAITDIRVFNYFSRTQDLSARFFVTDVVRALRDRQTLQTTSGEMVRDYLHPQDFYRLIRTLLTAPGGNRAVDAYSRAPIAKFALLKALEQRFGLEYAMTDAPGTAINATGSKPHYYSVNHLAGTLGYVPEKSSLDTILLEIPKILERRIDERSS